MSITNFISVCDNNCQNTYRNYRKTVDKSSDLELLWQKNQEKINNIIPKYYTVPLEAVRNTKYIFDYNNYNSNIDGQIGFTRQQQNDCWLLSGINALSNTKKGKDIIKKSIKKNFDNSITVNLKGINYIITIPKRTFAAAKLSKSYVHGDDDMLAIELATEFYKRELLLTGKNNKQYGPNVVNGKTVMGKLEDPLSGGYTSDIMYLLTGKCSKTYYNISSKVSKNVIKSIKKMQDSPDKYCVTCNFKKPENNLYIHHAYALKRVEKDNVVLINPHDTSKEEKISLKDFFNNVQTLTILEL